MACVPMVSVSWQANLKRKRAPLGFKNLGNTCYLNSVLQCLTYTPPLANFCLQRLHSSECNLCGSEQQCPFCLLEKRIAYHLSAEVTVDVPMKIYKRIQTFAKSFRPGRQEDAHELLRCAIEACNNVCLQLQKKTLGKPLEKAGQLEEPHTVVREIFGGVLQSQIKCLSCSHESNKLDDIMDLSLEVMEAKTLNEALSTFFESELLDGNNKYRCENCKTLSDARKQMAVHQAPNVLVIQFKRFENFLGGKIDRHIGFEEELQLSTYMSKLSKDVTPNYTLYGVLVHTGSSQFGGHYYAYVKNAYGRWYCCDDAHVFMEPVKSVLNEKAYMLFYVRSNITSKVVEAVHPTNETTPSPPTTPDTDLSEPSRVKFPVKKSLDVATSVGTNRDTDLSDPSRVKFPLKKSPDVPTPVTTNRDTTPKYLNKPHFKIEIRIGSIKAAAVQGKKPQVGPNKFGQDGVDHCNSDISIKGSGQVPTAVSQPKGTAQKEIHAQVNVHTQHRRTESSDAENIATTISKESSGLNNSPRRQSHDPSHITGENLPESTACPKSQDTAVANGSLGFKGRSEATEALSSTDAKYDQLEQLSELERLKLLLEKGGREVLQHCGWCDTLRDSLRAAKRQRLTQPKNLTCVDLSRKELIKDVKSEMISQVPQALKEQLVEQLRTFFNSKES